jgi:tetratricopeptide (TPR) repeat protein
MTFMKDRRKFAACAGWAVMFGAVWGCGSDSLPPQDVRNPEPTTALVTSDVAVPQGVSLGEPAEMAADPIASDPATETAADTPAPQTGVVDVAQDAPASPGTDSTQAQRSEEPRPALAADTSEPTARTASRERSAPSPSASATMVAAPTSAVPELRFTTPSEPEIQSKPASAPAAETRAIKAPVAASRTAAKPVTPAQPRKQEPRAVDSRTTNHAETAEAADTDESDAGANNSSQGPTFKLRVVDGSTPDQNSLRIALPGEKPKVAEPAIADVKAEEKPTTPAAPHKPKVAQVEAAGQLDEPSAQPRTERGPTLARRPADKPTPADRKAEPTLAAAPEKAAQPANVEKEAVAKPSQITSAEQTAAVPSAPSQEASRLSQSRLAAKTRDSAPALPEAEMKSPAESNKVADKAPVEPKPVSVPETKSPVESDKVAEKAPAEPKAVSVPDKTSPAESDKVADKAPAEPKAAPKAVPPAAVEAALQPPLAASDIAVHEHTPPTTQPSAELKAPAHHPTLAPRNREREVAERDLRKENSGRIAPEISQADVRVAHGFELAQRGAIYLARAEFIAGLRLIAQASDAETGTRQFSRAVNAGLLALRESGDFVRQTTSLDEVDIAKIVSAHKTPVLKSINTSDMAPTVAAEAYYDFAREQLTAAASRQMVASMALYGLAKATVVGAGTNAQQLEFSGPATLLYQTALAVEPRNFRAANDLGVLFVNQGQLVRAQEMLAQSAAIAPNAATFQNLAVLYARLGEKHLAEQMQAQARDLKRAGTDPTGGVTWVDPTTFASVGSATEAPLPAPVTQKPATYKPMNGPGNAAPEPTTPPANVAKRLTDWLPLNTRR